MPITEINTHGYTVDEKTLEKLEKDLGIKLEKSYRQFLLKNSACTVKPNAFYIGDVREFEYPEDANDVLMAFLGFAEDEYKTIELHHRLYVSSGRISQEYLPIGEDPFGNLIVLGVADTNFGQVFFWNHELEGEGVDEDFGTSEFIFLADNFNDFIDSFVET